MARPVKLGLDYFPTDTDILKNIKIRKLIRKYRELGFVLYLQLLTDIYRNSYFTWRISFTNETKPSWK